MLLPPKLPRSVWRGKLLLGTNRWYFSSSLSLFPAECDCGCVESATVVVTTSATSSTSLVGNNNGSNNNNSNSIKNSGSGGGSSVVVAASSGAMGAPSNGSKTAHSKVATGGGHANTQTSSKRSSSGADGDYQLVQHEVLYSLCAQYEVSFPFSVFAGVR